MGFTLLETWITNYCADTVEWCPIKPYFNYFVCGTYQLQETALDISTEKVSQSRLGQLHLFSVTKSLQLSLHCTIDCSSGVLDCKWCPRRIADKIIFITANADGKIALWTFEIGEGEPKVAFSTELEISKEHIILSVDWCAGYNKSQICVSDSAGNVSILQLDENLILAVIHKFELHKNEAWIATFGFTDDEKIYSGADDTLLKITDIRSGQQISELREHTGGVTSIRFNHHKRHIFASGSYDETVKLWDTRNVSRSLYSINLGGGIWRIKWDPQDTNHILVAGMYAGCFWLKYNSTEDSLALECSFDEHKTISYGADICHLDLHKIGNKFETEPNSENSKGSNRLTATCSFYDKKLCLCLI